jgi:hypothetical protein
MIEPLTALDWLSPMAFSHFCAPAEYPDKKLWITIAMKTMAFDWFQTRFLSLRPYGKMEAENVRRGEFNG